MKSNNYRIITVVNGAIVAQEVTSAYHHDIKNNMIKTQVQDHKLVDYCMVYIISAIYDDTILVISYNSYGTRHTVWDSMKHFMEGELLDEIN